MGFINTIFAVIDPTTQNQRALNRAVFGAKSTGARIHVYACIHSKMLADDQEELIKVETSRYQAWIDGMIAPIKDDGIEVEVEIEWNDDWRSAMGPAATNAQSDIILKNSHRKTDLRHTLLSSSDWSLFHTANCPVSLAKSKQSSGSGKILLAVDLRNSDESYDKIIDVMLDYAHAAEASYESGELHIISAYEGSDDYVHVTDLVDRTGVKKERIHVIGDRAGAAIKKCADELDAELILIGVATTSRLAGILFGSTTEWLLNHIDRDIMVIIPKGSNSG